MGRKISTGIAPQTLGALSLDGNVIKSIETNADILFEPNGGGVVSSLADIQLENATSLQLGDADSSAYVSVKAPSTVATGFTVTLPDAQNTKLGYALTADTSGNLSFAAAGPDLADDTTTNATRYLVFTDLTADLLTQSNVCTTKMTFNPSTGQLFLAGATAATDTTTGTLRVTGGIGVSGTGWFGSVNATGDITAFQTSDVRFKTNIKPIENALDKVSAIGGYSYDWTDAFLEMRGGENNYIRRHDVGLLADEVENVLPEVVTLRNDGYKGINYEKTISLLVEAIKELKNEIDILKAER
jgi:hypothetical protein